jgi:hypothetical protein
MNIMQSIQNRIYEIRGDRVMLDFDLAALYEVETKVFNQAVKRNKKRFPPDFMFRLTMEEWHSIRSQFVTTSMSGLQDLSIGIQGNWSQNVTSSKKHRPKIARPYAFTEQGVAMLSGILNSDLAIKMNIAIMRAFVELRKALLIQTDLKEQLKQIREHLGEHDAQLNQIYDVLENLLDERAAQGKWEERERIGFKK